MNELISLIPEKCFGKNSSVIFNFVSNDLINPDLINIEIHKAIKDEYSSIRAFYHSVIDGFEGMPYHPMWEKDVYPTPDQLHDLIGKGEMYLGFINGRIVSAMAFNHNRNERYDEFDWPTKAKREEVYVIHMLAVLPELGCRGIAKEMVKFAIGKALNENCKAIRLDVLKGNLPANKLYEYFGFKKLHTLEMFYPDTGWTDFELYELVL